MFDYVSTGLDWCPVDAALLSQAAQAASAGPSTTQFPQQLLQAVCTAQARACALSELAYGAGHTTHEAWQFAPFFCQGLDYRVSAFIVERVTQLVAREGYGVL